MKTIIDQNFISAQNVSGLVSKWCVDVKSWNLLYFMHSNIGRAWHAPPLPPTRGTWKIEKNCKRGHPKHFGLIRRELMVFWEPGSVALGPFLVGILPPLFAMEKF